MPSTTSSTTSSLRVDQIVRCVGAMVYGTRSGILQLDASYTITSTESRGPRIMVQGIAGWWYASRFVPAGTIYRRAA